MAKVYLLAATRLAKGWGEFLHKLGHTEWIERDQTDADLLAETAGRLCYRSWAPYDASSETANVLNVNIERIRHGNKKYLANILSSGHGSVLEHINFTFLLSGVSRVLTHELVRHRAGMAYSQESLRYCRLEHLELILPPIETDPDTEADTKEIMNETIDYLRETIVKLNKLLLENAPDFAKKKKMTSFIRRIAPIGISTSIIFTANARALRHIIQMRTNPAAEVEIRKVFYEVAIQAQLEAPHIFQDMVEKEGQFTFDG